LTCRYFCFGRRDLKVDSSELSEIMLDGAMDSFKNEDLASDEVIFGPGAANRRTRRPFYEQLGGSRTRMELKNIDLNLLVAFDALLSERNVTRAAERLTLTQPAVSAALARLRVLFEDPLLVRQGRHLVATPVAERLVEPVREALLLVQSTLSMYRQFDPKVDRRTFSIIASDYVTLLFLQPLLTLLAKEAPNVQFRIRPASDVRDNNHTEQVRTLGTDILIIPREVFPLRMEYPFEPLFTERYVCVCDADHPELSTSITLEQFSRLPYLATSIGSMSSLADAQLDKLGIPRNTEVTAAGFTFAYFMLPGTRLISLSHEKFGLKMAKKLNLRLLEPPMPLAPFTECMVWLQQNANDAGHRWLRERIKLHASSFFSDAASNETASAVGLSDGRRAV
jgi:DNA-binding transcriptional LysR family regulator